MESNFNNESFEFRACGPVNIRLKKDSFNLNDKKLFDNYITEYELDILLLLATEAYSKNSNAEISFQGIKNKLNMHQQKVSTALKRLVNKKLVRKTLNGYSLEKKGLIAVNKLLQKETCIENNKEEYFGLEISIPVNYKNKNNNLFKSIYLLKGRWFSHWRWVGMFSNPKSVKMEWQSLDGNLEACLCINNRRMNLAVFDKSFNSLKENMSLLEEELTAFIDKIQKIMDYNFYDETISKYKIISHSNCNMNKMRNWLSNYT